MIMTLLSWVIPTAACCSLAALIVLPSTDLIGVLGVLPELLGQSSADMRQCISHPQSCIVSQQMPNAKHYIGWAQLA